MFGPGSLLIAMSGAAAPAPVLTAINYDIADTAGGDSVTLAGTSLSGATCTVGGTSATVTANTSTSVTFTMPAKSPGQYSVQVTTAGGPSNTLSIIAEPSPLVWLPADQASLSGSNVVSIPQRAVSSASALALGISQATAGNRPTYQASRPSFGGKPTVVHSGTQYLDSAALGSTKAQPFTVYTVAEWTSPSSLSFLLGAIDGTSQVALTSFSGGVLINAGSDLNGGTLTAATATLVCAVYNGASSAFYISDMATAARTGTLGTNALRSIRMGASGAAGFPFAGAWGVLGAFAGAHDATTRARIGARLKTYYGI